MRKWLFLFYTSKNKIRIERPKQIKLGEHRLIEKSYHDFAKQELE
jgi:hypothetical protein